MDYQYIDVLSSRGERPIWHPHLEVVAFGMARIKVRTCWVDYSCTYRGIRGCATRRAHDWSFHHIFVLPCNRLQLDHSVKKVDDQIDCFGACTRISMAWPNNQQARGHNMMMMTIRWSRHWPTSDRQLLRMLLDLGHSPSGSVHLLEPQERTNG